VPTSLQPPIYNASRSGLVAQYSTAFKGDNQIVLPLYGSFQGDPVQAVSLMIDNYNNGIPVAFNVGGYTDYVPAYTSQYIDVTGMHTVLLSATDSVGINLALYDLPMEGGRSRGLPPDGASDPMWSNVVGLWHFDANPGATIGVDSKNSGLYLYSPNNAPLIVTTDSLFGGSSGYATTANQYANHWFREQFSQSHYSGDYTVDIAVKGQLTYAGTANVIASWTEATSDLMVLSMAQNGSNTRFELYRVNNNVPSLFAFTGWLYDAGLAYTWHQVAVTTLGGVAIWVDGVLASQSGLVAAGLAGYTDLFFYGNLFNVTPPAMWVDEFRITLGTRYTKNYTPATIEFPNQ
jgi:hypothetical protein